MYCMPIWKACNREVDYMDRSHCSLSSVPDDIMRYAKTLEELILDFNQLSELPRGLYKLSNLRKLSVNENGISRLSSDFGRLVNLEEFSICQNDLQEIPESIKHCKSLVVLDVSNNPIQRLPDSLTQLTCLTRLGLNNINIARLPNDVGSIKSLECLELRDNCLKYLPQTLSQLKQLRSLDLGHNSLEELPDTIGGLTSLEELLLDGNELRRLPKEIGALKKLTHLDVSENKIEELPSEMSCLTSLTDILLSENHLNALPDSFGQMKKLMILKADQNQIMTLTSKIGGCHALQEIILTENLLKELPTSIGKLKNLVNLNVDKNRLTKLPKEVGSCAHLGVLSVRDNMIEALPIEVGNLSLLHVLDVSGNRLRNLPITLSSCNLKAIWLSENQAQPLIKFQQDIDPETGQKVLICFLLPQQAVYSSIQRSSGKTPSLSEPPVSDNRLSWPSDTAAGRPSMIRFKEEDHPPSEHLGTFERRNTPFPKEIRAHRPSAPKEGDVLHHHHHPAQNNLRNSTESNESGPPPYSRNSDARSSDPRSSDPRSSGTSSLISADQSNRSMRAQQNGGARPVAAVESRSARAPTTASTAAVPITNGTGKRNKQENNLDSNRNLIPATIARSPRSNEENDDDEEDEDVDEEEEDQEEEEEEYEEEEITVRFTRKSGVGLGISIAGGVGSAPYKDDDESVFLSRVTEEGPSWKAGLRPGDKLISVNGQSLEGADHHRAVAVLKDAGNSIVVVVTREIKVVKPPTPSPPTEDPLPPPPTTATSLPSATEQTITTTLVRAGGGLGFSIAGGKGSPPYKDNDEATFISRIAEGGLAEMDGKLKAGDRLISINGVNVVEATHDDVVSILTSSGIKVRITVTREIQHSPQTTSPPLATIKNTPDTRQTKPLSNKSPRADRYQTSPPALVNFDKINTSLATRGSSDDSGVEIRDKKVVPSKLTNHVSPGGLDDPIPHTDDARASFFSSVDDDGGPPSDFPPPPPEWSPTSRAAPSLDDQIPHVDDEPPSMLTDYQYPRDADKKMLQRRERYKADTNLDYQIPHVEGKVGLTTPFDEYLDPLEDRVAGGRKNGGDGGSRRSQDMDNPIPHADDQVHFVKQTIAQIDADIPAADDYTTNYLTGGAGGVSTRPSRPVPPRPSSLLRSQETNQPPSVRVERSPPVTTDQGSPTKNGGSSAERSSSGTARVPSSPVIKMKGPPVTKSKEDVERRRRSRPPSVSDKLSLSFDQSSTQTPVLPPRKSTRASSAVDLNSSTTFNNSNVDALFSALDRRGEGGGGSVPYTSTSLPRPVKQPPGGGEGGVAKSSRRKSAQYPIESVTVVKAGGPLGLSIVGGADHVSHPFGVGEPGVFISKIVPDGAASKTTLRVGDRVLSVNGIDVRKAKHDNAVNALKTQSYSIELQVRRDPQPPGLQEIKMIKLPKEKLGLSIRGGSGKQGGNPLDTTDEGIFISRIMPTGAVARDGRAKLGMRILEVNGHSLIGCSHDDAVEVLRSIQDQLSMVVCDGLDPVLFASDSVPSTNQNARFTSLSSIDRDPDDTSNIVQPMRKSSTSGRPMSGSVAVTSSSDDEMTRPQLKTTRPNKQQPPPVAVKPQIALKPHNPGSTNTSGNALSTTNLKTRSNVSLSGGESDSGTGMEVEVRRSAANRPVRPASSSTTTGKGSSRRSASVDTATPSDNPSLSITASTSTNKRTSIKSTTNHSAAVDFSVSNQNQGYAASRLPTAPKPMIFKKPATAVA